jgi:predicted RecA/RadA family phage recombinase
MATNYVQPGDTITLVAPYQRNTGLGAQVGAIFGVALQTVANAVEGEFATKGVWTLAKTSAQAWTQGQKIYWDNSNKRCDSDSTVGMLIGVAAAAAANPSSTADVRLNGTSPATSEGPQAAIVALTDNTGDSGTHDDTLADGLTSTAPAAYAAVVNMTDPVTKAEGEAVSAALAALRTTVAACVTDLGVQNQNDSDLAQKILEIRTALIAAGILTA